MSGVKMIFTYDTDVTLSHAAALANTGPGLGSPDREELPDLPSLLAWMDRWEWTGRRPTTDAEVEAVRALRPRLRAVWALPVDRLAEAASALRLARPRHLRRRSARPQGGGGGGHGVRGRCAARGDGPAQGLRRRGL